MADDRYIIHEPTKFFIRQLEKVCSYLVRYIRSSL